MTDFETALSTLTSTSTTVSLRPRYEGNNINTWIGFKHVNYLVEEAVLEHFRRAGLPTRLLWEECGLGLDLVEIDTRILNAFHLDEVGEATVEPVPADGPELRFRVRISKQDGVPADGAGADAGRPRKDVTAKVGVALRRDTYVDATDVVPAALRPFTTDRIGPAQPGPAAAPVADTGLARGRGTTDPADPVIAQLTEGTNSFAWKWRVPYPYCHNNERLQMSGYLRQMEEVVDLFLADRGISIKTLLDTRRWIPVVPHSAVRLLDEVWMEEDMYTVYTVEEIFKGVTYRSRMDTWVVRDGRLVQTSTGTITHGYADFADRRDWKLVEFDDHVVAALSGADPAGSAAA